MDLKRVVLMALFIVILIVGGTAVLLFSGVVAGDEEEDGDESAKFSIIEIGRAGSYGYVVYDFSGKGNVTLISYRKSSPKEITIIRDDEGIEMEDFEEFTQMFADLENYGYSVKISDRRTLGDGIYVVPTGAMPTYVLDDLTHNVTDGVVIYLGKDNLVLRGGMQEREWYDELDSAQKDRILFYDKTLGEYMDSGDFTINNDILENKWSYDGKVTYHVDGEGKRTNKINMENGLYLRIIYDLGARRGITDSVSLKPVSNALVPEPENKYPWQDSVLMFTLNETEGYAYLTVHKDAVEIESKKLSRVTTSNVFREVLDYEDSGEYILDVTDNNGSLASGILHVKEVDVEYTGDIGYNFYFMVTIDGVPLDDAEVGASLNNSTTKKKFYVSDGELVIGAKLDKGENIFNIEIEGTTLHVPVNYDKTSIFDFYINYGIPGILLVVLVYAGARLSRRPTYILRATEGSKEIRKEIRINSNDLVRAFKYIRRDIKIGKSPISAKEFEIAIKRYLTKGADVTEGNIDEMLKRLVDKGVLETYRHHYQFVGEGDVRKNTLMRMVREKLIEHGISFKSTKNKFITKDCEIGMFGEKFDDKALIVVDDVNDIKKIMNGLSDEEKTKIRIKESNGLITFVPIDELGMVL